MRGRRSVLAWRPCAFASTALALALALALAAACAGAGGRAAYAGPVDDPGSAAQTGDSSPPPDERGDPSPTPDQRFAVHGQATYVEQDTDNFRAPYRVRNSLSP